MSMSIKRPRYYVRPDAGQWQVIDGELGEMDDLQIVAVVRSAESARMVCESLNRGLCQSVAPDGRWADPGIGAHMAEMAKWRRGDKPKATPEPPEAA